MICVCVSVCVCVCVCVCVQPTCLRSILCWRLQALLVCTPPEAEVGSFRLYIWR